MTKCVIRLSKHQKMQLIKHLMLALADLQVGGLIYSFCTLYYFHFKNYECSRILKFFSDVAGVCP